MTFHQRRRLFGLAGTLTLTGALMSASLDGQASMPAQDSAPHAVTAPAGKGATASTRHPAAQAGRSLFWDELAASSADAWQRLRSGFQWQDQWRQRAADKRVQYWIDRYRKSPHNIAEISERARPWLGWIIQSVEERGLPGEIALLPFIESAFDPRARSRMGAAGLWQIMPRTGDALGLLRTRGWDGRLDVVRSTRAALDYIELQAEQWYDGDIELSLAAYNAGAGTVNKARRRAIISGKNGEYWDLALPSETMNYVPKLLAIAAIIDDPERYGIALPAIDAAPAFARIRVTRPLALDTAAMHLGIPSRRLAALNPGLKGGTAHPGQVRELLVPADRKPRLMAALSTPDTPTPQHSSDNVHVVQRGDTLTRIASQHAVSPVDLARWNGIGYSDTLQPGQQLTMSK
ncbi:MAG TPA: transglycosylase SLT domain-containing protein [Halomonas sp.]|nr:transglycosylase SLT domain-containing protein [Halomonas sp.]